MTNIRANETVGVTTGCWSRCEVLLCRGNRTLTCAQTVGDFLLWIGWCSAATALNSNPANRWTLRIFWIPSTWLCWIRLDESSVKSCSIFSFQFILWVVIFFWHQFVAFLWIKMAAIFWNTFIWFWSVQGRGCWRNFLQKYADFSFWDTTFE